MMRVKQRPTAKGPIHRYFMYFTAIVLLSIGGMAAFHFFISKPLTGEGSPVDSLKRALGSVTNSEVAVDGYSLTLASQETRELIVVKRKVQSVVKYESSRLGSKKVIIVKGDFEIKAGFDLSEFEGFELRGNEAVGEWPEPRLLGVNLLDYSTFFTSSGVVNRISEADREHVVNLLVAQAKIDAIKHSDILEEAQRIIQTRLEDLTGGAVVFPKAMN